MVKKHEYNTLLKAFTVDQLVELYEETRKLFSCCVNIVKGISSMRENEIDDVDLMDIIEDNPLSVKLLEEYTKYSCSNNSAINRGLIDHFGKVYKNEKDEAYSRYSRLRDLTTKIVSDCAGVEEEQAVLLNEYVFEMAGFCLFFLKFEFDVDVLAEELENVSADNCTVNAILDKFCDLHQIDLKDEVFMIMEGSEYFKPVLPLFDSYPEIEEPFSKLMGPYLSGVDYELITIEMVKAVVDGKVSPEEFYERFSKSFDTIEY